jgi:hypothetical protein
MSGMAKAFLVTTFFVQNSKYESTLESELWGNGKIKCRIQKKKKTNFGMAMVLKKETLGLVCIVLFYFP